MDFYFTISKEGSAEYKDRGSKFLAYTFPVKNKDEFKTHLQVLKKKTP
jgi:putative IMPACT (imprinted ancient) family translation regulator